MAYIEVSEMILVHLKLKVCLSTCFGALRVGAFMILFEAGFQTTQIPPRQTGS